MFARSVSPGKYRPSGSLLGWQLAMGMTVVNVGIVRMSMTEPLVPVNVGMGLSQRILE